MALENLKEEDSNLIKHAKREFARMGYIPLDQDQEDGPNKWIQENVLELLRVFSNQGHSGFSAKYCISYFNTLANYKLLSPVKSEDEFDFLDIKEIDCFKVIDSTRQSRVCNSVFLESKYKSPYFLEGIVFKEGNDCFTGTICLKYPNGAIGLLSSDSFIKYPFMPKTFTLEIERTREIIDGHKCFRVLNPDELSKASEYYDLNIEFIRRI